MIALTVSQELAADRDTVFLYLADPRNLSAWNSAVVEVSPLAGTEPTVGARYTMRRQLPTGRAENELEIVALDRPGEVAIRTLDGPTPFAYRYRLADGGAGGTLLTLDAEAELGRIAALAGPRAATGLRRGLEANLASLRQILG